MTSVGELVASSVSLELADAEKRRSVREAVARLQYALDLLDAGTRAPGTLAWEEMEPNPAELEKGRDVVHFAFEECDAVIPFDLDDSPQDFVVRFVSRLEDIRDRMQRSIDGIAAVCPAAAKWVAESK